MRRCSCTTWRRDPSGRCASPSTSPSPTARSSASVRYTTRCRSARRAWRARRVTYARQLAIGAARDRVFEAVGTVDGPRHWWTTVVTGSAALGGELRFGFAGLDEQIVMRVEALQAPSLVAWACVAHTRGEEWTGSTVRFELADCGPRECRLDFQHIGMPPDLVAKGWDHFLASLSGYLERGTGTPFGA